MHLIISNSWLFYTRPFNIDQVKNSFDQFLDGKEEAESFKIETIIMVIDLRIGSWAYFQFLSNSPPIFDVDCLVCWNCVGWNVHKTNGLNAVEIDSRFIPEDKREKRVKGREPNRGGKSYVDKRKKYYSWTLPKLNAIGRRAKWRGINIQTKQKNIVRSTHIP